MMTPRSMTSDLVAPQTRLVTEEATELLPMSTSTCITTQPGASILNPAGWDRHSSQVATLSAARAEKWGSCQQCLRQL